MDRVFQASEFIRVADGTLVGPVIGPWDVNEDGPPLESLRGLGVAVGHIEPGVTSEIHVLPIVTQVTWVVSGRLTVKMKDAASPEPYENELCAGPGAAAEKGGRCVMNEPGTVWERDYRGPDSSVEFACD